MRIFFLFQIFLLILGASAIASQNDVPVCIKSKEARALFAPPPKKKPIAKRSKKSKKKSIPLQEPGVVFLKYTPFKFAGKKERGWLEVQSMDGKTYWLRSRDVSFQLQCLSVRVNKSRMFEGPGPDFPKLGVAEKGDSFLDLGGEDGWTRVRDADGNESWINLDHIWKVNSRVRMSFSPENL